MSTERALLAALRAAAAAAPGVQALLGSPARLYDERPPDALYPFVTLGRVETQPGDAAGAEALEHVVTLHVWSRYGGRAEALGIVAALRDALHDQPLSVTGRRLVLLYVTFSDVFRDADGRTTHGVVRLRAITEAL